MLRIQIGNISKQKFNFENIENNTNSTNSPKTDFSEIFCGIFIFDKTPFKKTLMLKNITVKLYFALNYSVSEMNKNYVTYELIKRTCKISCIYHLIEMLFENEIFGIQKPIKY